MSQLTSLTNLKSYLKISDTTDDVLLQSLIDALSNAIEKYLGRFVINTDITSEIYDCNVGVKSLQLNFYPVNSVIEISQTDDDNDDPIDTDSLNIDNEAGILTRDDGYKFYGELKVTYNAGICADTASVPKDIQLALWQWIENVYRKQQGNTKSENLGDYSISYFEANDPMPTSAKALLDVYKKVVV